MRCCRIYKTIQLVKDARLNFRGLLLLIDYLKILVQNHDRGFGDHDSVAKLRCPIHCFHFGYGHLV